MLKPRGIFFLTFIGFIFLISCRSTENEKKIFYINSYHPGYGSSDDITEGILQILDSSVFELRIRYMDSKNNPEQEFLSKKAEQIFNEIISFGPDVIIASDDNAIKYLVKPYLKDGPTPVVFCGVNWSADDYGLPNEHVTGMLEILPVLEGVQLIQQYYADIKTVYILSENTISEKKNTGYITKILNDSDFTIDYNLAGTFAEWKKYFAEANLNHDVIFMPTNGGIRDWKNTEAVAFVKEHLKKPVITCDDFMMPYSVLGITKIQKEQGLWAAEMTLKILNGRKPGNIPIARNSETEIWLNPALAEIIKFQPGPEFLEKSKIYNE